LADAAVTAGSSELRGALERAFAGRAIARIGRKPSAYRTSFPLEQLEIVFADGTTTGVMFKDLSRGSLAETTRRAKPSFLHEPMREIEAYRLLAGTGLGAPECYGSVVEPIADRFWLFLEKISGVELYQVGELETWQAAARWLARLHSRFAGVRTLQSPPLLRYDAAFLRLWPDRAAACFDGELERIAARYDAVVERVLMLPTTFLHGEFYASNVLVSRTSGGLRVAPVDWEMAAVGPGLVDLAALSAGGWGHHERGALADAYVDELALQGAQTLGHAELREALGACTLHLALQWLGWSENWSPPPEHTHDWLTEALEAAERLGL
jgi:Phosphotransferase enzyme family